MTITLTPAQEELVRHKIESGQFNSPDEVVNEALRLFDAQYHEDPLPLEELRRAIAIAVEQEERGEVGPLDIAAIIAEGHKRLAEKGVRK